jgi:putative exosortase-associated protein (TIGR04073 family)
MKQRIAVCGIFVALLITAGTVPAAAEPMEAGRAFTKLTRGFVNIITGWVEVPKRIQETSHVSGAAAGFTWGLLRGLGHGFIRTAAGFYEFFTFPFPAPPGYAPVIQPEYVFTEPSPDTVQ